MPTIERPIANLHTEVYAPTGGFIFGVSVFVYSEGNQFLLTQLLRLRVLFPFMLLHDVHDGTRLLRSSGFRPVVSQYSVSLLGCTWSMLVASLPQYTQ